MGNCLKAIACPGCHGDIDKSAAAKAIMVFVYTFLMAGYFFSYAMGCEKMPGGVSTYEKAHYDFWRRSGVRDNLTECYDETAVNVMAYFSVYVILCILSLLGASCMFCAIKGYNKVYAICVVGAWVWLSIQDFWTLGAMLNYFESVITNGDDIPQSIEGVQSYTETFNSNLRSEFAFRIMGIWFAETFIFLSTAYDAFDRSDEQKDGYRFN